MPSPAPLPELPTDLRPAPPAVRMWQPCGGCGQPLESPEQCYGGLCPTCHSQTRSAINLAAARKRNETKVREFLEQMNQAQQVSEMELLTQKILAYVGGLDRTAAMVGEVLLTAHAQAIETGKIKNFMDAMRTAIFTPLAVCDQRRPKQPVTISEEEANAIIAEVLLRHADSGNEEALERLATARGFRLVRDDTIDAAAVSPTAEADQNTAEEVRDAG